MLRKFGSWAGIIAIAAVLGLGGAVVAPASDAWAFCASSIDPKCNPQLIPLLTEKGIINVGTSVAPKLVPLDTAARSSGFSEIILNAGVGLFGVGSAALAACDQFLPGWCNRATLGYSGLYKVELPTRDDIVVKGPGPGWSGGVTFDAKIAQNQSAKFDVTEFTSDAVYGQSRMLAVKWGYFADFHTFSGTPNPGSQSITTTAAYTVMYKNPATGALSNGVSGAFNSGIYSLPRHAFSSNGFAYSGSQNAYTFDHIKITYPFNGYTLDSYWYPAGHPLRVPEEAPSVKGETTTKLECRTVAGVDYVVTAVQRMFNQPGRRATLNDVVCDNGDVATSVETTWKEDNKPVETIIPKTLQEPTVVGYQQKYPDCFGVGRSCTMELWKVGGGGLVESCGTIGEGCVGWSKISPKTQVELQYDCKYGPYTVDIDFCSGMRAPDIGLLPNTGTERDAEGNLKPLPYNAPLPSPESWPKPTNPTPGSAPWVGALPAVAPNLSSEPAQCFPSGWGVLNPVSWVMMPVQCALNAAFVPKASVTTGLQSRLTTAVEGTGVATVTNTVTSIGGLFANPPSGCTGPPWHLQAFGINQTWYPFNACVEPIKGAASAVKGMLTFSVAVLTLLASTRYITGTLGFMGFGASAMHSSEDKA